MWRGDEWLIESGLRPGERVVAEGFHRIQPGIQVNAIQYQRGLASSNKTGEQNEAKKAP
jgi:membrane fusion protein (multidrug efflux system)